MKKFSKKFARVKGDKSTDSVAFYGLIVEIEVGKGKRANEE
jgi:hypothetical protein